MNVFESSSSSLLGSYVPSFLGYCMLTDCEAVTTRLVLFFDSKVVNTCTQFESSTEHYGRPCCIYSFTFSHFMISPMDIASSTCKSNFVHLESMKFLILPSITTLVFEQLKKLKV